MKSNRSLRIESNWIHILGDTFPIKEQLKTMGARWNQSLKIWMITHEAKNLEALISLGFLPIQAPQSSETQGQELSTTIVDNSCLGVREFVQRLNLGIQQLFPEAFWIVGESSSVKWSGGHLFLDLCELQSPESLTLGAKTASVSCVLWKNKALQLNEKLTQFPLEEGIKLKLLVHCEIKREQSRVSLIISDIDTTYSLGDLALKRQLLVTELKKRNLYHLNKQKSLSPLPFRIALITAYPSRAVTDFIDELTLSKQPFVIRIFDCSMQGEHTSKDVSYALKKANQEGGFNAIVITRGGGSRLDLRWFDDLEICKSIAYSEIPVISAIGHTDDISVADEVSWRAEKTPTGAARFLTQYVLSNIEHILDVTDRIALRASTILKKETEKINIQKEIILQKVRIRIQNEKQQLTFIERLLMSLQQKSQIPLKQGYLKALDKEQGTMNAQQISKLSTGDEFYLSYLNSAGKLCTLRVEVKENTYE